jgi:hypothetical protein
MGKSRAGRIESSRRGVKPWEQPGRREDANLADFPAADAENVPNASSLAVLAGPHNRRNPPANLVVPKARETPC